MRAAVSQWRQRYQRVSHTFKALKTQAQNWHIATSAAFHWPQQVSRTAQIQGMERFQHFVERTTMSCCKGHGYNQGWEIWPIGVTNILQSFFFFFGWIKVYIMSRIAKTKVRAMLWNIRSMARSRDEGLGG